MTTAATYSRSSKDRSDVSIDVQERELDALAEARGLKIVQRYADAVESGSTDERPDFSRLVRDLRNRNRGWSTLLIFDTSRLARRRHIALIFEEVECRKHGVRVIYKSLPESDPITEMLLKSILQAMDEWHSLTSRAKGLAGMAENVRQGWRAGGRAPHGYRLESHATGAIRDGKPVLKSTLLPTEHAGAVAEFLKARAAGEPRSTAGERLGLSPTTLIGMEWNALVYAGHTIWNRHGAKDDRGNGRPKRRPRSQWVIKRDTHPALITDAQAEAIIAQLENSKMGAAVSRGKQAKGAALLAGLLFTTDGRPWVTHGRHYRLRQPGRGKLVAAELIDAAVLRQVEADRNSDLYLRKLLDAAKAHRAERPRTHEEQIRKLEREKARAAELAIEGEAAYVALVAQRSRQIEALRREAEAEAKEDAIGKQLAALSVETLRDLLEELAPESRVEALVERIELDPDLTCRLVYKAIPGRAGWRSVASPRVDDGSPHVRDLGYIARRA